MSKCGNVVFLSFLVITDIVQSAHFNGATISWKSSKTKAKTATFFWKAGWVIGRGPCGATCDDTKLNTYGVRNLGNWKCYSGCTSELNLATQDYWITSFNIAENYEQGENSFTHTFDSDHDIKVGFKGYNWRSLSSVTAGSWAIVTTVDLRVRSDTGYPNSSPTTVSKPVFRYQFSCLSKLVIPLVDPDGDIAKCRWAVGDECASACSALPGAVLDEETCTIDFTAAAGQGFQANGWYVASLIIADYPRENITVGGVSKTTKDELSTVPIQFLITTPSYAVTCDSKPNFTSPTPPGGQKYKVAPNGNLILKLYATNPVDPTVRVDTFSISAPTGLLRTAVRDDDLGRGNHTYIALYWTPTEDQKGENVICVMAQDTNGKTSDYRCFYVLAWDYDECLSGPCINGGTCLNLEDKFLCLCPTGYFAGVHCEIDIHDSCIGNACQNNATCQDGAYNYTCQCQAGYVGNLCQTNFDECHSNPCQNNGTCNDLVNKYTCSCPPGFNGFNCENNINECYSSPCWKGSCNDKVNGYTCTCNLGWTGTNCFQEIDECTSNPCQNNATCIDNEAYYLCQCQTGFAGLRCQTDIDECGSNPCMNNGTCDNLIGRYECQCPAGMTGRQCETNIDECASSPCEHGKCVDMLNGYQCNCTDTWYGVNCQYSTNPCWSFPCRYGGTCINRSPTYECKCAPGWMGENCEYDFNECISNPCPVNATCVNRVNLYECVCPPNWKGVLCDIPVNVIPVVGLPTGTNANNAQQMASQNTTTEGCSCNTTVTGSYFTGCDVKTNCSCVKGGSKEPVYEDTQHCDGKIWPKVVLPLLASVAGAVCMGVIWAASTRTPSIQPLFTCSNCGHEQPAYQRYIKSASSDSHLSKRSTESSLDKELLRKICDDNFAKDLANEKPETSSDLSEPANIDGEQNLSEVDSPRKEEILDTNDFKRTLSSKSLNDFIANL